MRGFEQARTGAHLHDREISVGITDNRESYEVWYSRDDFWGKGSAPIWGPGIHADMAKAIGRAKEFLGIAPNRRTWVVRGSNPPSGDHRASHGEVVWESESMKKPDASPELLTELAERLCAQPTHHVDSDEAGAFHRWASSQRMPRCLAFATMTCVQEMEPYLTNALALTLRVDALIRSGNGDDTSIAAVVLAHQRGMSHSDPPSGDLGKPSCRASHQDVPIATDPATEPSQPEDTTRPS